MVEDDPKSNELLSLYLTRAGYQVHQAYDGQEGLEKARRLKPSAIVLDIMLPRVDGWQVLDELKRQPETRDIPVVIVSMVEEQRLGLSLGAADYFVKPVQREKFLARLGMLVSTTGERPPRVLVVDDEPQAVELVAALLEKPESPPRFPLHFSWELRIGLPERFGGSVFHWASRKSSISSIVSKVRTRPSAMARSAARSLACHTGVQK